MFNENYKNALEILEKNINYLNCQIKCQILKSDCVSFLYETLEKFDPSKGSKAFSYFNVVAKNWLIIQSKKRVKNFKA